MTRQARKTAKQAGISTIKSINEVVLPFVLVTDMQRREMVDHQHGNEKFKSV
jgi:hypothetical protein